MAQVQRSNRIRNVVAVAGIVGQIPGLIMLSSVIGFGWALVAVSVMSLPFFLRVAKGNVMSAEERGLSGLAMLIFFTWWGASLLAIWAYLPSWAVLHFLGALRIGRGPGDAPALALAMGGAFALVGVTWNRLHAELHRVDVPMGGLPESLDGYSIAQMSDLHLGGHTPASRVRGWVDRINALSPDLIAITGDLITMGDDHLESIAEELGRLRAPDGVALCMGNHDYFCDASRLVAALEASGIEVLRNRGRVVDTGRGSFFLAGIDDTWSRRSDVALAMRDRPTDLLAVVLAHDPRLFDECVAWGAQLVLSGHTHGGQVALPILGRTINLARIAYRHTVGLYQRENGARGTAFHYVSRGAGTTGPPMRVGMPSELTLIRLRSVD